MNEPFNHAHRTRPSHPGCNRRVSWPPSLSLGRSRMRAHASYLATVLLAVFVSCDHRTTVSTSLDISVRNDTTNALDWVELVWDGPSVVGGILSPGISKTTMDIGIPKSDTASLEFVTKTNRQPHKIAIDVSALKRLSSGRHDVVISIRSVNEAALLIDAKDQ